MSNLEPIRDIAKRLFSIKKEAPGEASDLRSASGPAFCICGAEMKPTSFYGWGRKPVCRGATVMEDGIVQMIAVSCERPGCAGNFAEISQGYADRKMEENRQAMHMDGVDREFLRD